MDISVFFFVENCCIYIFHTVHGISRNNGSFVNEFETEVDKDPAHICRVHVQIFQLSDALSTDSAITLNDLE